MTTQNPALDLHPASTPEAPRSRPRSRASAWPWVPALLLGSLLGTQLAVLSSALDDPAFSTEPDYYRKALDWDAQQARARESQALGWTARASTDAANAAATTVSVSITDAEGAPVSGARVGAMAFPNVRATEARELTFRELSPGLYRAELGAARAGLWELRCSASRGQQRFESTLRFEIDTSRGAR